ncbi:MAG: DUF1178 family protein [Deltaproteobacteria bacterium]|nr:DUF1178 family protein [Deltaproteobacteria bacterium]
MIAFDLICSQGHKFECWFKNSESFEEQKSFGVITCPICHDNHVEMVFSTFAIRKHGEKVEKKEKIDPHQALQAIHDYIDKNFEEVGLNFTKEALKIHYGEAEKRNIKGMALPNEEKVLKEEGVQFFKIPIIKRLDN